MVLPIRLVATVVVPEGPGVDMLLGIEEQQVEKQGGLKQTTML